MSNGLKDLKMIIGVIADTHIPSRAKELPEKLVNELRKVDLIIHAGDFVESEVLEMLEGIKKVEAVFGNMDEEQIKIKLPGTKIIELEGIKIGIVHGCDICWDLNHRVPINFKDEKLDCVVFGHTHVSKNERIGDRLFFNPGSPTDEIFISTKTFGILEIKNKKIEGRIIEL